MAEIFVNTDNSDVKDKMYNGVLAGEHAAAVEKKMGEIVTSVIAKTPGFTTNKLPNPKGYSIKLKLSRFESTGRTVKCTVTGEVLRYPNMRSARGSGVGMLSTRFDGSAEAQGMGKFAVIDCVDVITDSMMKKAIPAMRLDISRW